MVEPKIAALSFLFRAVSLTRTTVIDAKERVNFVAYGRAATAHVQQNYDSFTHHLLLRLFAAATMSLKPSRSLRRFVRVKNPLRFRLAPIYVTMPEWTLSSRKAP